MAITASEVSDCIVVGGGAAGLSAATILGRALRSTLVVDAGQQSNLAAPSIGGVVGQDRRPPAEFYANARAELAAYADVQVHDGKVDAVQQDPRGGFTVSLADGTQRQARRVLLALGMHYERPAIPGLEERWGDRVFHCPFCHGWEMRGRRLGVLADGPFGVQGALTSRAVTSSVTLLTHGVAGLDDEQRAQLTAGGVAVDERPVKALRGPLDGLEAVEFADGDELAVEALLVRTPLRQRSDLARRAGASVTAPGPAQIIEPVEVDPGFETAVPGLYAAGDMATSAPPSLPAAIQAGYMAGASIVMSLMATPART